MRAKPGIADPAPGEFQAIAGMRVPIDTFSRTVPIVPELYERAGQLLTPSTKWCTRPSEECGNSRFDVRVPQENELSDDNDGVESSWKYYLGLAKQAAAESDLLANEYISTGLDLDLREEEVELREAAAEIAARQELETLQNACGATINLQKILDALAGGTLDRDLGGVVVQAAGCPVGEVCACSVSAPCDIDYDCRNGMCVASLERIINRLAEEDPEMRRIKDCMLSGVNLPSVTLGNKPLCFTRNPGQPNQICEDDTGNPVPFCPTAVESETAACPDGLEERTADELGFFSEDTGSGFDVNDMTLRNLCSAIRGLPRNTDPKALETLLGNGSQWRWLYSESNLKPIAESIRYEDEPGNYARVYLGRNLWITTGTSADDPARAGSWLHPRDRIVGTDPEGQDSEWPCDGIEYRDCGFGTGSNWREFAETDTRLFCSTVPGQCADQEERARFNQRLRDAIAFLRFSLGLDASTIRLAAVQTDQSADDLISGSTLHPFPPPEALRTLEKKVWSRGKDGSVAETYLDHPDIWFSAEFGARHNSAACSPWGTGPCITIQEAQFADDIRPVANALSMGLWSDMAVDWTRPEFGYHDHVRATIAEAIKEGLSRSETIFRPFSLSVNLAGAPLEPGSTGLLAAVTDHGIDLSSERFGNLRLEGVYAGRDLVGNFIGSQPFQPTIGTAYDAMDLVCEAHVRLQGNGGVDRGCVDAPLQDIQVTSIEDLSDVANHVGCMATALETIAARTLLFNFPKAAVDALKQQSGVGAYPGLGGEFSQQVSAIRAALIELHDTGPKIASEVNQLRFDIDELKTLLEIGEIRREIEDKEFWKEASQQMSNCVTETIRAGNAKTLAEFGAPALAAAATCINSALQINLSAEINKLAENESLLNDQLGIINFRRNFENRAAALRDLGTAITTAQENLDAALANLENLQKAALRSLEDAIWLSTTQASQQYSINSVMRRRFSTSRVRYQRAHEHAKQMARLAKRAIEARLGVRLSTMVEDLPLVGAPSGWEADICATSPVDYVALREVTEDSGFAGGEESPNFADAFIGEYVRKLESVVESYRQVRNFHEGTDTAVISLRDDIMNVQANCPSPSSNLIANSATLDRGWSPVGCSQKGNCVSVEDLGESPVDPEVDDDSSISSYRIVFGISPSADGTLLDCPEAAGCGVTADTMLAVPVGLGPGEYLLSWYARQVPDASNAPGRNPDGSDSIRVFAPDGTPIPIQAGACTPTDTACLDSLAGLNGWQRYIAHFAVTNQTYAGTQDAFLIGIVPNANGGAFEASHQIDIAAIQVESATHTTGTDPLGLGVDGALPFEATDANGQQVAKTCTDNDGVNFRSTRWSKTCLRLCDEGFTGECAPADAREFCYREASFGLSQREIEQGSLFTDSGFAYGNFNYRIETLGLNFVGTDIRNCAESETPESCYAGGFTQYSLRHEGPYFVRNYDGEDAQVELFTGNIEHARGLATERYITNPISDSDRSLIDSYMRAEFQGRPLDGTFTVRIWEDQNSRFDQIRDIQLVLKYRYWTRFD